MMRETLWELDQAQPQLMCELLTNQKPVSSSLDQSEAQSGLTGVSSRGMTFTKTLSNKIMFILIQVYIYFLKCEVD